MAGKTRARSVNFNRRKKSVKRASSSFLRSTRLRSDPLGEFSWATGGQGYLQDACGNSQPQFGLWYSPARRP
jgi:hypothetical protein